MTLTWDDPGDDSITGYVILRRDSAIHEEGTFETVESDTGSAETTYTDDSAQPERKYVYRIKAINEHGLSEISSWVRAYTPAAPVPAAPTTFYYIIPTLPQAGEGFLRTNQGLLICKGKFGQTRRGPVHIRTAESPQGIFSYPGALCRNGIRR